MSDKMRDEFNEWREKSWTPYLTEDDLWQAWQASRAALVVELPDNCKGMALTVDELRVMLDEIGVTMK